MKKFFIVFISGFLIVSCQSSPKKISRYQLRSFREVTLSNGLPVLLVPDRKLPYFEMSLIIHSGSSSDPKEKMGLSNITAKLLDKGTEKRRGKDITNSLEQLANRFRVFPMRDTTKIKTGGLSFYKSQLLKDFSEILLQPTFPENEIKDMKEKVLSGLIRTVDYPGAMMDVVFQTYLYEDHPYGRRISGRRGDIKNITRNDILRFYNEYYTPKNSMLIVVGNFDDRIVSELESHLGSWKGGKAPKVKYTPFPGISGLQIRLVDHPDVKQTQVRFAHKGIRRSNPDYLALMLANVILGGGFESRLLDKIRKEKGLTYGIRSRFDSLFLNDLGSFIISTSTRHGKVGEIVRESLKTLSKFIESGVTNKELAMARATLKGYFSMRLETAEGFASDLSLLRFHGVSKDYLVNFYKNVDNLSQSDVNKVIKKYFSAKNIKIGVYGPKTQVLKQLQPIGSIETLSYKEFIKN